MKLASIIPVFVLALSLLGGFTSASMAQESRWGSPDEETVKFIIAVEAKWASSACSPQPDLKAVIADDFQGTSPTGRRYGNDEAITTDTKSLPATANSARSRSDSSETPSPSRMEWKAG